MAIHAVASLSKPPAVAGSGKEKFATVFREALPLKPSHPAKASSTVVHGAGHGPHSAGGSVTNSAAATVERVQAAQARLDRVFELARSGKTFTPAELLGLQAQVYEASQQLDLASRVVEKATSGVKQVLQTQV
jgi:hypothetical protein